MQSKKRRLVKWHVTGPLLSKEAAETVDRLELEIRAPQRGSRRQKLTVYLNGRRKIQKIGDERMLICSVQVGDVKGGLAFPVARAEESKENAQTVSGSLFFQEGEEPYFGVRAGLGGVCSWQGQD